MDAVLHVYMIISGYGVTKKARDGFNKNRMLWSFTSMPTAYSETITFCVAQFWLHLIDPPGEDKLTNIIHTLRMLIGISLAYPDPGSFEESGVDRVHYLPGIRLLRMMRACGKDQTDFHHGEPEPSSLAEMEANFLKKCDFPYPSYASSQQKWLSYFKKIENYPYPSLTKARFDTVEQTFGGESNSAERVAAIYSTMITGESAMAFSIYYLPLLFRRTDGMSQKNIYTNRAFRDKQYDANRLRHILGWRMTEFFLKRRARVLCPFGTGGNCEARVARCSEPYADLSEVPDTEECFIRLIAWNREPNTIRM